MTTQNISFPALSELATRRAYDKVNMHLVRPSLGGRCSLQTNEPSLLFVEQPLIVVHNFDSLYRLLGTHFVPGRLLRCCLLLEL